MTDPLPRHASIVIVGGGAVGCAIVWALTREGITDVVLLEKAGLTHGSTWHAAGLVGQLRTREDLTLLMRESVAILDEIEAETSIGWRRVGSLRIASSEARLAELRASDRMARAYGVTFDRMSAAEAAERFPYLSTDGVTGAGFVHGDGYVDPTSLTNAYAARARRGGARLLENVTVTAITDRGERGFTLATTAGEVSCDRLVLAPGVWARSVGAMLGLPLAVAALEHHYVVTEKLDDVPRDLPALRDPDLNFYAKPETGSFAIGGWERGTGVVHGSMMPFEFGRRLLPDDLERIAPVLEAAARRIPVVGTLGLRQVVNGPIPVTPDGEPILGPAPGRAGLFLAVGFTSGIAASGGAGRQLARWIAHGRPDFALPSLDPARFSGIEADLDAVNDCAREAYSSYYSLSRDTGVDGARSG